METTPIHSTICVAFYRSSRSIRNHPYQDFSGYTLPFRYVRGSNFHIQALRHIRHLLLRDVANIITCLQHCRLMGHGMIIQLFTVQQRQFETHCTMFNIIYNIYMYLFKFWTRTEHRVESVAQWSAQDECIYYIILKLSVIICLWAHHIRLHYTGVCSSWRNGLTSSDV